MFEYTIKKSKRARNISIRITPPGDVKVTAPVYTSDLKIRFFVNKNFDWIEKKLQYFQQFKKVSFNQDISKQITFLGKNYPVEIVETSEKPKLDLSFNKAIFYVNKKTKKELNLLLNNFYKNTTKKIAENLIKKKMTNPPKISIRNQKTRWGSCSSKGRINLNLKLSIAPTPVFNYVVCHELAHLKYFNHSKQFWKEVERLCPEYKTHRLWLKKNGFLLNYSR